MMDSCCILFRLLPFSPISHHHPHHLHSLPIATKLPSLLASSSSSATSSSSPASTRRQLQGRRELLGGLLLGVVAVQGYSEFLAGCRQAMAAEQQQQDGQEQQDHHLPEVGLTEEGRLRGCNGSVPCVSTSAFQSPSHFMPPWIYLGNKDEAYNALKKALVRMGAEIVTEDGSHYIYAFLPSGKSRADVDDLEFLFVGNAVCYRSVSRVTIPDPPFCWWPGCINGPRNRGRLERLRDELGWVPLETDEDKHWVPLLLH